MYFRRLLAALALFGAAALSVASRADLPIIYSARYYYPPGSRATSHFHLYLTDTQGRQRRQLTRGRDDDRDPVWSPDGRMVLFERDHRGEYRQISIMILEVATSGLRTLWTYKVDWGEPVSHYLERSWMPDSRRVAIERTTHKFTLDRQGDSEFV